MAKRSGNRLLESGAVAAGQAQAKQAAAWLEQAQAEQGVLPLAAIQPRPGGNSRPLRPDHVVELAESIAAVGLIEPLVVDRHGHLLAGGHREAALRLLALADAQERVRRWLAMAGLEERRLTPRWQAYARRLAALPALDRATAAVAVVPFNAAQDPARALAIEASENTQRRAYSRTEITSLVQRLRAAGFVEREGRPRAGEKALRPALSVIVGKSPNTVRRWLGVLDDAEKTCPYGHVFGLPRAARRLRRAIRHYRRAAAGQPAASQELLAALERVEALLEEDDALRQAGDAGDKS
ncbi:MAG: ParB N-terminal domain-containing protein [Pseudomonadota bacterium]|nr:ParB N-terminal domain-containing protein [Pseudomonadota bacterium]